MSEKKRPTRAPGDPDVVLAKAFAVLPRLLTQCDPEAAARIIADLLKVRLAGTGKDDQGAEAIDAIVGRIAAENGDTYEPHPRGGYGR